MVWAAAPDGSFWVAGAFGFLWQMTSTGAATFVAGSGEPPPPSDGFGSAATFDVPRGIAVDTSGQVYLLDLETLRLVSQQGLVATLIPSAFGFAGQDGTGSGATLQSPIAMAAARDGGVWVDDGLLRRVSSGGVVQTFSELPTGIAVDSMVAIDGAVLFGTLEGIFQVSLDTMNDGGSSPFARFSTTGDQLAVAPDGTLASTFDGGLRVHLADGGLNLIYSVNDGGNDTLGPIVSFAPGQWLVTLDRSALLVVSEDGGARLLAGRRPLVSTVGPADQVSLNEVMGLAVISSMAVCFFSQSLGPVSQLVDGQVITVGPSGVEDLTMVAGDQVIGLQDFSGECLFIPYDGGVLPISDSFVAIDGLDQDFAYYDGVHIMHGRADGDGGYTAVCPGTPAEQDGIVGLIHDGDGGFFIAANTKLTWLDSSCQYQLLGFIVGGKLNSVTRDPSSGAVYAVDQLSKAIYRVGANAAVDTGRAAQRNPESRPMGR